jgi:ubiquinone biosynthesis protein COQ4
MTEVDMVRYFKGDKPPQPSSVLASTSKYLNNPLYRDVWCQFGLRKVGPDVPNTYLIPEYMRAMEETTDVPAAIALLAKEKAANPVFARWLDKRHLSSWKKAALAGHAPGTLGHRIYRFIADTGMEMDFISQTTPTTDFEYFKRRRIQDHDIEHMVTGLNPSPVGEMALQILNAQAALNFFSAEFWGAISPGSMFLVGSSLMRACLHHLEMLPDFFEGIGIGHRMGKAQKQPLFLTEWEQYLDWKISDIREELNLQEAPGENAWAHTYPMEGAPVDMFKLEEEAAAA